MNLKEFDLDRLTILWQASIRNEEFRVLIEAELRERILSNRNFSREYIFRVCRIQNHAITISFIPTTESYNYFGPHVTIDMILTEEETEELLRNTFATPPLNTSGQIKAKALLTDKLSEDQIEVLKTIGFNTSEILETLHF